MKNKSVTHPQNMDDLVVSAITVEGTKYWALGLKDTRQVLAITGKVGAGDDDASIEMATRIVACLRACDGIDIEVLNFFAEKVAENKRATPQTSEEKQDFDAIEDAISHLSDMHIQEALQMSAACIEQARKSSSSLNRKPF